MELLETERWRANDNFVLRTVAGESVLVPVGEVPDVRFANCMITMNETGAFLWDYFSAPRSYTQAVQAAEAAFSAPEGEIALHVKEYIIGFAELGLLLKEE